MAATDHLESEAMGHLSAQGKDHLDFEASARLQIIGFAQIRGFQKLWFVGSFRLCGLSGRTCATPWRGVAKTSQSAASGLRRLGGLTGLHPEVGRGDHRHGEGEPRQRRCCRLPVPFSVHQCLSERGVVEVLGEGSKSFCCG